MGGRINPKIVMTNLSFKYGGITRTLTLPIERPKKIFVEFANGDEARVQKIYSVSGRASCVKILVNELPENPADLDEIHNLRQEVADFSEEISGYKHRISELEESAEKQENELDSAENALEDFEYRTGFKTSARSLNARIEELANHVVELQEKLENMISCAEDKKFY